MKKIVSIIGARPQFIKHAPIDIALKKYFKTITIHTGQHFDFNMSSIFFRDLKISDPDYTLTLPKTSLQSAQTAAMMTQLEELLIKESPNAVLLYGDTNSTLAGALSAVKLSIPIIHIEAGLRSFNRHMPEEVNRIITDVFSYLLFCPTSTAIMNLKKEGINHDRIFNCGDVMKDTLDLVENKLNRMVDFPYYYVTIHRPYNTDDLERIKYILGVLNLLNNKVIFSLHPRTKNILKSNSIDLASFKNINFIDPVGYLENISYQKFCECVITDSGGMQKEAYMLKKKCITIRTETEWVETLNNGWNTLLFENLEDIKSIIEKTYGNYIPNLYGDGKSAVNIVETINQFI